MAVRVITAPPGMGKTLNMTRVAIKLYKEANSVFNRMNKKYIHYNSIYSNYPILLWYQRKKFNYKTPKGQLFESVPIKKYHDEELKTDYYKICDEKDKEYYGCFSLKLKFTDMRLTYNFGKDASFFIDELQYIYDSAEYKDFPDCIAHFFQVHRHLGYNMIYTNSQSLSRVIKRVLCVSEEFWNVLELKQLFIFKFLTKVKFKITYDLKNSKNDENSQTEDFNAEYNTIYFFNKRVYNGYITKYLGSLNNGLPMYNNESYNSLKMEKSDILKGFMITSREKQILQEMEF